MAVALAGCSSSGGGGSSSSGLADSASSSGGTGSSVASGASGSGSSGSAAASGSSGGSATTSATASSDSGSATGSGSAGGTGTAGNSGSSSGGPSDAGGCHTAAACAAGQICDADYGQCCPAYVGKNFYVDGVLSVEAACCGASRDNPCASLTHTMDLLQGAGLSGATITAYNSDQSADWVPSFGNVPERWPIHLGLGVTLFAPGLNFAPPQIEPTFVVSGFSASDTGQVTLAGTATSLLNVGAATAGPTQLTSLVGIVDGDGPDAGRSLPLALDAVVVSGAAVAMQMGGGAVVTLGPGPTEFFASGSGFDQTQFPDVVGPIGVSCRGTGTRLEEVTATVDAGIFTAFSSGTSLFVGDGCQAVLRAGPSLGFPAVGQFCQSDVGSLVKGTGSLVFGSLTLPGAFYCANAADLDLEPSALGQPSVSIEGAQILQGCVGVYVNSGSFHSANSSYFDNYMGLVVSAGAQAVDLGGDGGSGGANVLACNGASTLLRQGPRCNLANFEQPGGVSTSWAGANVLNLSSTVSVQASHCSWDDWAAGQTQIWSCDPQFGGCSCSGPSCPTTTIPESLVHPDSTNNGTVPRGDAVFLDTYQGNAPAIDSRDGAPFRLTCPTGV